MNTTQARARINAARNLIRPLPTKAELDEAYLALPDLYQVGIASFAVALAPTWSGEAPRCVFIGEA